MLSKLIASRSATALISISPQQKQKLVTSTASRTLATFASSAAPTKRSNSSYLSSSTLRSNTPSSQSIRNTLSPRRTMSSSSTTTPSPTKDEALWALEQAPFLLASSSRLRALGLPSQRGLRHLHLACCSRREGLSPRAPL